MTHSVIGLRSQLDIGCELEVCAGLIEAISYGAHELELDLKS